MPAELKPDATCPKCGDDLAAVIWTRRGKTVKAEYIHAKAGPRTRRRRPCSQTLTIAEEGALRRALHEAPHA